MAAKMDRARLKHDKSSFILANKYDISIHGEVICPDIRCGCNISWVRATTRNIYKIDGTTEQVDVTAYFRLPKGSKNKKSGHAINCRFNSIKTIEKFLPLSEPIDSFNCSDNALISRNSSGDIEFRLHILMNLLISNSELYGKHDGRCGADVRVAGAKYSSSGNTLLPYLRVARAINSLIARFRGGNDLGKNIILRYGDKKIRWSDYFYNINEHERLSKYIINNRNKTSLTINRIGIPVAFAVQLKKRWEVRKTKNGYYQFACEGSLCELPELGVVFINPVLYTKNESIKYLLENIKNKSDNCCVLVCSIPSIGDPWKKDDSMRYRQSRLNMNINHRCQLCLFSPAFE